MSATVLDAGDKLINKTDTGPALMELTFYWWGDTNTHSELLNVLENDKCVEETKVEQSKAHRGHATEIGCCINILVIYCCVQITPKLSSLKQQILISQFLWVRI